MVPDASVPEEETDAFLPGAQSPDGDEVDARVIGFWAPKATNRRRWQYWLAGALAASLVLSALAALHAGPAGRTCVNEEGAESSDPNSVLQFTGQAKNKKSMERRANAIVRVLTNKKSGGKSTVQQALQKAVNQVTDPFGLKKKKKEEKVDEQTRKASCIFDILRTLEYAARIGLIIDSTQMNCKNALDKPVKSLEKKLCGILSTFVFTAATSLGSGIAASVTTCSEASNLKAACAVVVQAQIGVLTQIAGCGVIVAEFCDPTLLSLPDELVDAIIQAIKDQEAAKVKGVAIDDTEGSDQGQGDNLPVIPGQMRRLGEERRLFLGGAKDNNLASCVLNAFQLAWSLAGIALSLKSAITTTCPPTPYKGLLGRLTSAGCTLDIGSIVFGFCRFAFFVTLSLINCAEQLNFKTGCAIGLEGVITGAAGTVIAITGMYAICDKAMKIDNLISPQMKQGFDIAVSTESTRRLLDGSKESAKEALELATRYGFNASNPSRIPVIDDHVVAMEVLETFTRAVGLDEDSLKKKFGSPAKVWEHLGFNRSNVLDGPVKLPNDREAFVRLMEPALSEEIMEEVDALAAIDSPKASQLWSWPWAKDACL